VTDATLPSEHAQALGSAFTHELDSALQAAQGPHALRIGQLVVEAPAHQLNDRQALQRLAQAAAARILARARE
jgi:hypothetical protein